MMSSAARTATALAAWTVLALPVAAGEGASAKAVLGAAGVRTGLCLHLGCGSSGAPNLVAELAAGSDMLVHGLAVDDAALGRARRATLEGGVAGRAVVAKLAGKSLPYLPDMASLVVIENRAELAARGIGNDEILRVLAPGGRLCEFSGGKWTTTTRPRPAEMDEWTHPHHGPDGSLTSNDRAVSFPISLRWIAGTPFGKGGFAQCAPCRAAVLAGGRCFSVNVDSLHSVESGAWLVARDAYSGMPLWKMDCEATYGKVELDWRNVWPLVATDRLVYTRRNEQLAVLEAATGREVASVPTGHRPVRLLLAGDTLVAACWEKTEFNNYKDGFENDRIRSVWWPAGAGSVEAFEAGTGKPRWKLPLTALTIVASGKTLYVLTHQGNPPTSRELIAVDLATGAEKWRVPHTAFGEEADTCLNFAGPGCVVVSKTKARGKRGVFVLAEADGKILHSFPDTTARNLVGKELWCTDGRYDVATGAKLPGPGVGSTYAGTNVVGGCVPPIVIAGRYVTGSRRGSFLEVSSAPGARPVKLSYSGARGACLMGMLPANGMLYTAQNNCSCVGAQPGGFLALGPGGTAPAAEDFKAPRPLEKGPAFGASGPPAAAQDWPTYRQNAERSGGCGGRLPAELKILWKTRCAARPEPPFADAWNSRIGRPQPLTAPVVAAGKVFIAGLDSGEVTALDPAKGTTVWKRVLGGRIDSPGTYHAGLLLIGCRDGWVYALRAADGELAYRLRVAPLERLMVAHGAVESVWPANGAVLVHDSLAYATAGRSTRTDGGIAVVAFRPGTGETVWARAMGDEFSCLTDALSVKRGELAWNWLRLYPKTGVDLPPDQKYYNQYGMIDASWTSGFGRRSGRGFSLGRACNSMMAWNDRLVVPGNFAVGRDKVDVPKPTGKAAIKHPDRLTPEEMAWRTEFEPQTPWARIYAMALTADTALFAGSVYNGWAKGRYDGSFLWVKSAADGKSRGPALKLDAAPVYDGLAAADGRVYLALDTGELLCLGK